MAARWIKLEDYDVSPTMGFVPENPLLRLPDYFSPWEKVCDVIPQMLKDGTARCNIEKLPLLDVNLLSSEKEWYRAHLLLAGMTHTYVWCQGERGPGVAKVLPKCVAVPFVGVSRHLDLPPVMVYYVQALSNWRKIGPNNSDFKLINTLRGIETEESFFLNNVKIELEFGKGGALALINGQQAVLDDDISQLITELVILQEVIKNMTSAFVKIHDICDPKEFFDLLLPFLSGWGEKGSELEDGLIYEGVSTAPMKYAKASAAQTSIFQAIDGFLEIKHKTKNDEEHFLNKIRLYMPPKHRAFISAIENGPSVKSYVLQKNDDLLTEKYNGCLNALQEYRSEHLRVVVKYVICQINKTAESKIAEDDTGGSAAGLVTFLKAIRSDTVDVKI